MIFKLRTVHDFQESFIDTGGTHLAGCKVTGLKPVEPRLARRLARRVPTGLVPGVLPA